MISSDPESMEFSDRGDHEALRPGYPSKTKDLSAIGPRCSVGTDSFLIAEVYSQVRQGANAFHFGFSNHSECILQNIYGGKEFLVGYPSIQNFRHRLESLASGLVRLGGKGE